MSPALRRSAAASLAFHVLVGLLLFVGVPRPKPSPSLDEIAVTMEFAASGAASSRADQVAPARPAQPAADAAVPVQALPPPLPPPPAPVPPAPVPPASVPPAPAPPLPTPPAPSTPAATPVPAPTPPVAPPVTPSRPPTPPAPVVPAPAPAPATPPRPPTPAPPAPTPAPPPRPQAPSPPPPTRPAPTPPATPPAPPSAASQPPARTAALNNSAVESALERLRAAQAASPTPRGAPGGGSPSGLANAGLTAAEGRAIGDQIRECWTSDSTALDYEKQSVRLLIKTDAAGVVRVAEVAPSDAGRAGSGVSRAFAERARRAALDPDCAQLPLPSAMRGRPQTFEITFRP